MIDAGVTLAMIDAGVNVLYASGSVENRLSYADRNCVANIFVAMLRAKE